MTHLSGNAGIVRSALGYHPPAVSVGPWPTAGLCYGGRANRPKTKRDLRMTEHKAVTPRGVLKTGAPAAPAPPLAHVPVLAAPNPMRGRKMLDFYTGADINKAEAEGELVYYGHDSEAAIATLMDAFRKDFPKIKTSYVRLQTGALYAKITAERSSGRFGVDVLQLSDVSPA